MLTVVGRGRAGAREFFAAFPVQSAEPTEPVTVARVPAPAIVTGAYPEVQIVPTVEVVTRRKVASRAVCECSPHAPREVWVSTHGQLSTGRHITGPFRENRCAVWESGVNMREVVPCYADRHNHCSATEVFSDG